MAKWSIEKFVVPDLPDQDRFHEFRLALTDDESNTGAGPRILYSYSKSGTAVESC